MSALIFPCPHVFLDSYTLVNLRLEDGRKLILVPKCLYFHYKNKRNLTFLTLELSHENCQKSEKIESCEELLKASS